MTYTEWFYQHGDKHKEIMDRLDHLSMDEVIKNVFDRDWFEMMENVR